MGDDLESNLIIRTEIKKPNRQGFASILKDIEKIDESLNALVAKQFVVRVRLEADKSQLSDTLRGAIQPVARGPQVSRGGTTSVPAGVNTNGAESVTVSGSADKTGQLTGEILKTVQEIRSVEENSLTIARATEKITHDEDGAETKLYTSSVKTLDIKKQLLTNEEKRLETLRQQDILEKEISSGANPQAAGIAAGRADFANQAKAEVASRLAAGFTQTSESSRNFTLERVDLLSLEREIVKVDKATGAVTETRKRDRRALDESTAANARLTRELEKQEKAEREINIRQAESAAKRATSLANLESRAQVLATQGFREGAPKRLTNARTGETDLVREFSRVRGNPFKGFEIDIERLNQRTGQMTTELLQGSKAWRFLGDNIVTATAKVTLWLAATEAVFQTRQAFIATAQTIAKLEEGTATLARVGKNLGEFGLPQNTEAGFRDRLDNAKQLTAEVIKLTAAVGGDAIEAQQSAIIFAKAGQTKAQVLNSVRAALIAARLGDLNLTESSNLLAASIEQFNLHAEDLLPIMDALQSISSTTRVSVNDLLESVARSGSVAAESGESYIGLAAATGVVAEATGRAGSQVGNAFKTILSNLDKIKTQEDVFNRLGISLTNAAGDGVGLNAVLLQLQTNLGKLNELEQRQLTLNIAGARQRNVLVAAIQNADKIIAKEISTLLDAGAADRQLTEQSGTLISALQRLKGSFVELATEGGSPINELAHTFVNFAQSIIDLLTIFGGVPSKLGVSLLIFVAIGKAIELIGSKVGANIALQRIWTESLIQSTAAVDGAAVGTGLFANSLFVVEVNAYAAALAIRGIGIALLQALGPAAIIGAVIYYVVEALGSAANAAKHLREAQDSLLDSSQRDITIQANRAKAYEIAANSVIGLLVAVQKLKAEQAKTGKDTTAEQKILLNRANNINSAAGLTNLSQDPVEAQKKYIGLQQQASKAEAAELQVQKSIHARRQAEYQSNLNYYLKQVEYDQKNPEHVAASTRKEDEDKVVEFRSKLNEESAALVEIDRRLAELKNQTIVNPADIQHLAELRVKFFELNRERERAKITDPLEKSLRDASGLNEAATALELYNGKLKEKNRLEEIIFAKDAAGNPLFPDAGQLELAKLYVETLKEMAQLQVQISNISFTNQTDFFKQAATDERKLAVSFREAAALRAAAGRQDATPQFQSDLEKIEAERSVLEERIKANRTAIASDETAGKNALNEKERERAAADARARQLETSEDLNRLADLELEKADKLAQAEARVAAERKKSADEVLRALGGLNDEDKLRLRAQAKFLAANPNAKFSADDLLNFSSSDTNILEKFFPGRLPSSNPAKPPAPGTFEADLVNAGAGVTPQQQAEQKAIDAARAGRTDAQIQKDAEERARKEREEAGVAAGRDNVRGAAGFRDTTVTGRTDAAGHTVPNLNLNVQTDIASLQPLVDELRRGVDQLLDARNQDVLRQVREILDQQTHLPIRPDLGLPNVAGL